MERHVPQSSNAADRPGRGDNRNPQQSTDRHVFAAPVGMDETDMAIVERLQLDGRASYKSIGDSVGVSETTARKRLIRLLDDDLLRVVAILNTLAPATTHIAMVEVNVEGDPAGVAEELGSWPETTFIAHTAGVCDLLIELVAVDRNGLYEAYRALHRVDGVKMARMNIYLRVSKQLYWGPQFS